MSLLRLGVLASFIAFSFSSSVFAESTYGIFMVIKGTVEVQNPQVGSTIAKVGTKVFEGDLVITGLESRAKIVMSDRNVINLSPDTKLKIQRYINSPNNGKKDVELNLLQGRVRTNVEQKYDGEKNKFIIKTPTAVAGVRGTEFMTAFDPKTNASSIVTFKGAVKFFTANATGQIIGSPVIVKRGEKSSATNNEPPQVPRQIPRGELKSLDVETASTQGIDKASRREIASEKSEKRGREQLGGNKTMLDKKDFDLASGEDSKLDGKLKKGADSDSKKNPLPGGAIDQLRDIKTGNLGPSKVKIEIKK